MSEVSKSHHHFVVSNYDGIVIRCCMHCGLSHQMEACGGQNPNRPAWRWNLIIEEKGDESFAEPCPVESGSDDLFPYHHFILSNHHKPINNPVVIRFCVRCGLSHYLDWTAPLYLGIQNHAYERVPNWQPINENKRDLTVSDLCMVEQGDDVSERRYLLVPKN